MILFPVVKGVKSEAKRAVNVVLLTAVFWTAGLCACMSGQCHFGMCAAAGYTSHGCVYHSREIIYFIRSICSMHIAVMRMQDSFSNKPAFDMAVALYDVYIMYGDLYSFIGFMDCTTPTACYCCAIL